MVLTISRTAVKYEHTHDAISVNVASDLTYLILNAIDQDRQMWKLVLILKRFPCVKTDKLFALALIARNDLDFRKDSI